MAKKKAKPRPSKKPKRKTKRSKARPSKKKTKSEKPKKSSKPESFTLITLSAKTGKPTQAKRGQDIFFALKSSKGKITKLETSKFPQKFYESDLKGVRASFKQGSPQSFLVYQQFTRTPQLDKQGHFLYTAEGAKLFQYKLTGKKYKTDQRTVIDSIKGYVAPTGKGFTQKTSRESAKKLLMIPLNKKGLTVQLTGETIKDTVRNLKPALGTKAMVKKGIHSLTVDGFVTLFRPRNPFKQKTPEFREREAWLNRIWGPPNPFHPLSLDYSEYEAKRKKFPEQMVQKVTVAFGMAIDRLVNFSDALATHIRQKLSNQGLRFTSLYELGEAETRADEFDQKMRDAGYTYSPGAPKIMKRPTTGKGTAADLVPLRPENESGYPLYKKRSKLNTGVFITLTVKARK